MRVRGRFRCACALQASGRCHRARASGRDSASCLPGRRRSPTSLTSSHVTRSLWLGSSGLTWGPREVARDPDRLQPLSSFLTATDSAREAAAGHLHHSAVPGSRRATPPAGTLTRAGRSVPSAPRGRGRGPDAGREPSRLPGRPPAAPGSRRASRIPSARQLHSRTLVPNELQREKKKATYRTKKRCVKCDQQALRVLQGVGAALQGPVLARGFRGARRRKQP